MHSDERLHHMSDDTLDGILREELRWQVPSELTNQLLLLVSDTPPFFQPSVAGAAYIRSSPRTWYSVLVMVLTSVCVGLSFAVAWQFYGVVGTELGLMDMWHQIQATMSNAFQWLYHEFPMTRTLISVLVSTYEHTYWVLNWLLVSLILWLALDGSSPSMAHQRHYTKFG